MNSGVPTTTETKVIVTTYNDKIEVGILSKSETFVLTKDEGEALFMCLEHLYGNTK